MKFMEYYKSLINEGGSGFLNKENANHFISLVNKYNGNKFYPVKTGDYYTLGYKEKKKLTEEIIEEVFKDIKHYNGVTIAPGVENTALVNIGDVIYIVNQDKRFHIRNDKGEMQEVPTPEEFKDETLMNHLNDMLNNPAAERIAA